MPRILVASDDFNRAGPALGANWNGVGNCAIVSSNHYEVDYNNTDFEFWVGTGTFNADQYSEVTIGPSTAPAAGSTVNIGVRHNNGGGDFYYVSFIQGGSTPPTLYKITGGSYPGTSKGTFGSSNISFTDGDKLSLEVQDNGSSQPVFKCYKNTTQIGSDITDSAASPYASGVPGFGGHHAPFAAHSINDWEGGNGALDATITGTMATTLSDATLSATGSVGQPSKKVAFSVAGGNPIRDEFQALVTASGVSYAIYNSASILALSTPVETGTFNIVGGEGEIFINSAGINVGQSIRVAIASGSDYAIPALTVVAG